jgi:4'-phosphopantetheinyl transferase
MTPPPEQLLTVAASVLTALSTPLSVAADTVHVWAFTLEAPPECVALCRGWLSASERDRADRFVFERDRLRYTLAHGVLRRLLSLYIGTAPAELEFSATRSGKPALENGSPTVAFNLTHSEDRGAVAVSVDRALGIDLEKLRSNIEALSISRNYFFGSERTAIESAPPAQRDAAFFRYWVAKEAVLKAEGIGLGFPLDRFRVDFLADGQHARIETFDPAALAGDWAVRMLPCDAGWLGAVAARGTAWKLRLERPRESECQKL